MPCTSPLDAWPAAPGAPDGRYVFSPRLSYEGAVPVRLPCGKCRSCKLERAADMAVRAVHEAQMFAAEGRGSSFVTLTFSDEHLPSDRSLSVSFIQRFHYRLRKVIGPFRFLLCGEYGERDQRPHYHAIYFGHDFWSDRYVWKRSTGGLLYRSPTLERVWTYGHCLLADFTRETGGYTARYSLKKVAGDEAEAAYRRVDPDTGECWQVAPEFLLSSRSPGLGASWFDRFKSDVFPSDHLVVDGRRVPVPRYYLKRLEEEERAAVTGARKAEGLSRRASFVDPRDDLDGMTREECAERARGRARLGSAAPLDDGDARLLVKHELQEIRAKRLLREFDAGS